MKSLMISVLVFVFNSSLIGQETEISFNYEVAPFYQFKKGAVSLTFDDGFLTEYTIGLNLLEKYHISGTFFLPALMSGKEWDNANELVENGHEVGAHTLSHPKLNEIPIEEAVFEISNSKLLIEENIPRYSCFSFAYPHGRYNEDLKEIVSKYFEIARSVDDGYCSVGGVDYFQVPTYFFNSRTKLKEADSRIDYALHNCRWLVESYHGFDGDGYQPISSSLFEKHLQYIKSKESNLWIARFKDVAKYFRERENCKLEIVCLLKDSILIKIDDGLSDSIYNQPLSIKIKIPEFWNSVKVISGDHVISISLNVDVIGNKFIVFETVPNSQVISIIPESKLEPEISEKKDGIFVYPNPFNGVLNILWHPEEKGHFSIMNLKGQIIMRDDLKLGFKKINLEQLEKGVYLLKIDMKSSIIKKIVKE